MRICLEASLDRLQSRGEQTPDSAPRAVHRASIDDVVRAAPRPLRGETRQESAVADEEWPTTQRYSRRAGEAFRGADYAAAVEMPAGLSARDAAITIVMVICALLGAAATSMWQV